MATTVIFLSAVCLCISSVSSLKGNVVIVRVALKLNVKFGVYGLVLGPSLGEDNVKSVPEMFLSKQ